MTLKDSCFFLGNVPGIYKRVGKRARQDKVEDVPTSCEYFVGL
jgi:hypothetical protein